MKQWNPELKPKKYVSALAFSHLETINHYADFDKPPASIPEMPKKRNCIFCNSKLTTRFLNQYGNWATECLVCGKKIGVRYR